MSVPSPLFPSPLFPSLSRINMDHYDNLVALDFPKGAAAEALKQTNNNFDAALEVMSLSSAVPTQNFNRTLCPRLKKL